jgi:hypothetical protein
MNIRRCLARWLTRVEWQLGRLSWWLDSREAERVSLAAYDEWRGPAGRGRR